MDGRFHMGQGLKMQNGYVAVAPLWCPAEPVRSLWHSESGEKVAPPASGQEAPVRWPWQRPFWYHHVEVDWFWVMIFWSMSLPGLFFGGVLQWVRHWRGLTPEPDLISSIMRSLTVSLLITSVIALVLVVLSMGFIAGEWWFFGGILLLGVLPGIAHGYWSYRRSVGRDR